MKPRSGIPKPLRTAAACLLLLLHTAMTGCYSWATVAPGTSPLEDPQRLRIAMPDTRVIELTNARFVGDSIVGDAIVGSTTSSSGTQFPSTIPMAVAVAQVHRVEHRRFSAGKTAALVLIPVVVIYLAATTVYPSCEGGC